MNTLHMYMIVQLIYLGTQPNPQAFPTIQFVVADSVQNKVEGPVYLSHEVRQCLPRSTCTHGICMLEIMNAVADYCRL